ncbi:DUF6602 domain-containing protein [Dyadobacter sp.]|uniref:DUF6602 domain-containing protein n=1 Tax=Dyadobacter sp. TaxID=1914288 RepID=UPI003F6F3F43
MQLSELFGLTSDKLLSDFKIGAQLKHNGNIGDYREDSFREFLTTKMPHKFGIGNGEVVGFENDTSRQSDLIIYDKFEAVPLVVKDSVQAYPAGSIYGIIEVKSQLSKEKLIEGLDNIKSVKALVPNEQISRKDGMSVQFYPRPKPFGCIFAFSLGGNSMNSLVENLRVWERSNEPQFWPNMVVVLNEGIVAHYTPSGKLEILSIDASLSPFFHNHQSDTLFQFYSNLIDLCNSMNLPKLELSKYRYSPKLVLGHTIKGKDILVKKSPKEYTVYELTDERLRAIISNVNENGVITRRMLMEQFSIAKDWPLLIDEDTKFLLYDPEMKFRNKEYLETVIKADKSWKDSFSKIFINDNPVYIPHVCLEY